MQQIKLKQTLPEVFADHTSLTSDIWNQDVTFEKGQIYLLEAASGTGKSSVCSFIYGYRRDYSGTLSFDDADTKTFKTRQWTNIRKESISLLFQDLRLFPELTSLENVLLKNKLTHFKTEQEIETLFEQLLIADKIHEKVDTLSFGQQQRVAFIRSLCQPFDFILLDEPISHLDDENGQIMARILTAEASKQGAGIIVTSIGKHITLDYNHILKL